MDDVVGDIFRVINVLLILAVLVLMANIRAWFFTKPKSERVALVSIPIMLVVLAFGTIETILHNIGFGARVVAFTPSLILLYIGLMKLKKNIDETNRDIRREDHRESGRN